MIRAFWSRSRSEKGGLEGHPAGTRALQEYPFRRLWDGNPAAPPSIRN